MTSFLDFSSQRLLTVVIKPFRIDAVLEALKPFRISSLTCTEVRGYGRQKGHLELYKGGEYVISFVPKLRLEILVAADDVDDVTVAIRRSARTGRIGDGKIFTLRCDVIDLDCEGSES
ncbi:MAG: P-II family nitrogen regulator [Planctomycetota bacterium]